MKVAVLALAVVVVLGSLCCAAQQGAMGWRIQSPYPNNPLKQATLAGTASHAGLTAKAEVQLECRPDANGPRLNIVFTPKKVKFDADPFEGPGGLGERQKLRAMLAKEHWEHHFSGYYVDADSFVLSLALEPAEARKIADETSEGEILTVSVAPAKAGEVLRLVFHLPQGSDPVRAMLQPCLSVPHRQ